MGDIGLLTSEVESLLMRTVIFPWRDRLRMGRKFLSFVYLLIFSLALIGCQSIAVLTAADSTNEPMLSTASQPAHDGSEIIPVTSEPTLIAEAVQTRDAHREESDCLNQAEFIEDITVRDNTQMDLGDGFVKIWRLRNIGTCTWTNGYSLVFIGGDRMNAPKRIQFGTSVAPGQLVDLVIDFTVPELAGAYQSFWKLQPDTGRSFGIGPNGEHSFWVKIMVESPLGAVIAQIPTLIVTPAISPTRIQTTPSTGTLIPSPLIHAQGFITLAVGETLDLDSGSTSAGEGIDVALEEDESGQYSISPSIGAVVEKKDIDRSDIILTECNPLTHNPETILIEDLSVNDIICYRTNDGRMGYFRIKSINGSISFDFITWAQ